MPGELCEECGRQVAAPTKGLRAAGCRPYRGSCVFVLAQQPFPRVLVDITAMEQVVLLPAYDMVIKALLPDWSSGCDRDMPLEAPDYGRGDRRCCRSFVQIVMKYTPLDA